MVRKIVAELLVDVLVDASVERAYGLHGIARYGSRNWTLWRPWSFRRSATAEGSCRDHSSTGQYSVV